MNDATKFTIKLTFFWIALVLTGVSTRIFLGWW